MENYLQHIIALLEEFYRETGLTITLFDIRGNCVAHFGGGKKFCRIVKHEPVLCRKCNGCNAHAMQCVGAIYETRCPMRLRETTIPVFYREKCAGYLMIGKFLLEGDKKSTLAKVRKMIAKYRLDRELENSALEELLPPLSETAYRKALSLLSTTAKEIGKYACALQDPHILRVKEVIADRDGEIMTSKRLAGVLRQNRRSLERTIKQKCGETPADFIADQNLTFAEDLLMNSEMSLRKIATELGYNYRSFLFFFKSRCGLTPHEFRTNGYAAYRSVPRRHKNHPPF